MNAEDIKSDAWYPITDLTQTGCDFRDSEITSDWPLAVTIPISNSQTHFKYFSPTYDCTGTSVEHCDYYINDVLNETSHPNFSYDHSTKLLHLD